VQAQDLHEQVCDATIVLSIVSLKSVEDELLRKRDAQRRRTALACA